MDGWAGVVSLVDVSVPSGSVRDVVKSSARVHPCGAELRESLRHFTHDQLGLESGYT